MQASTTRLVGPRMLTENYYWNQLDDKAPLMIDVPDWLYGSEHSF
jgi:hypothetical protein